MYENVQVYTLSWCVWAPVQATKLIETGTTAVQLCKVLEIGVEVEVGGWGGGGQTDH